MKYETLIIQNNCGNVVLKDAVFCDNMVSGEVVSGAEVSRMFQHSISKPYEVGSIYKQGYVNEDAVIRLSEGRYLLTNVYF